MKITSAVLAGTLALGLGAGAQAQTIPNPTNPTPPFPVATDGSPLPYHGSYEGGVTSGRGAYRTVVTPFNALAGTGLDAADGVADGTAAARGVR